MGSRYLPALFIRHKETSGDAVVTSPTGCGELPRERFGARDSGGPSDQIGFTQPASLLAEGASSSGAVIWRVAQQSFLSSAVPP